MITKVSDVMDKDADFVNYNHMQLEYRFHTTYDDPLYNYVRDMCLNPKTQPQKLIDFLMMVIKFRKVMNGGGASTFRKFFLYKINKDKQDKIFDATIIALERKYLFKMEKDPDGNRYIGSFRVA